MTALARSSSGCKLQTRSLVGEDARANTPQLSDIKNLVMGPVQVCDTKATDRLDAICTGTFTWTDVHLRDLRFSRR
jgi:hypothetical protein